MDCPVFYPTFRSPNNVRRTHREKGAATFLAGKIWESLRGNYLDGGTEGSRRKPEKSKMKHSDPAQSSITASNRSVPPAFIAKQNGSLNRRWTQMNADGEGDKSLDAPPIHSPAG
jgi:hypothetical protein